MMQLPTYGEQYPDGAVVRGERGRRAGMRAAHRPQSSLETPMIGFEGVIRVLLGDVARGGEQLIDHSRGRPVPACPVGGHFGRA
jgi:hypothetical protein